MIYSFKDTVPKNTPVTSKRRTIMKLTKGVVHQVEIQFPVGVAALACCQITDGLTQIWPSNPDGYFAADGFVISFKEDYEIKYLPYNLYLYTWNTSTDYDHTITVRFGLLPSVSFIHRILPDTVKLFLKI